MTTYANTPSGIVNWKDHGGTGPTIVLVHGLAGSLHNWDSVAHRFAEVGHTVALDLPGFGLSPPAKDRSIDGHVATLVDFIGQFDTPVNLVGNSMGGLITQITAARRPDLVSALVLVSPAIPPRFPVPRLHWRTMLTLGAQAAPVLGRAMSRRMRRKHTPESLVEHGLRLVSRHPSRIAPERVQDLVNLTRTREHLPWAANTVPDGAREVATVWLKRSRLVAMIREISPPTLVVHGVEDQIISPTSVEWVCSLRPDWKLVQMPDTGHVPQLDAPVRFSNIVIPWLQERL